MANEILKLRVLVREQTGKLVHVSEQQIPKDVRNIELALRRLHFRSAISQAILTGRTVTIEAAK